MGEISKCFLTDLVSTDSISKPLTKIMEWSRKRLLMTTWCFPEPMEKSLHGLMKTENPDFLAIFGDFLSTFRKCRPSYVKQEMFFQGAKQITPNEYYIHITTKNHTHTKK